VCTTTPTSSQRLKFGRRWLGSVGVAARRHLDLLASVSLSFPQCLVLCGSRRACRTLAYGLPHARTDESTVGQRRVAPHQRIAARGEPPTDPLPVGGVDQSPNQFENHPLVKTYVRQVSLAMILPLLVLNDSSRCASRKMVKGLLST
jgi:hypothetical protein